MKIASLIGKNHENAPLEVDFSDDKSRFLILLNIFKDYAVVHFLYCKTTINSIDFGGAKFSEPSGCARRAVELVAEEGFGLRTRDPAQVVEG